MHPDLEERFWRKSFQWWAAILQLSFLRYLRIDLIQTNVIQINVIQITSHFYPCHPALP